MSLHGRFVLAAVVAFSSATAVDAATARVDEAATLLRTYEDHYDLRLVVRNPNAAPLEAVAEVELLDPGDGVRARAKRHVRIAPGLENLRIALRPGISALDSRERTQVLHYRLRYLLELQPPPARTPQRLTGILSVSRITPDVFELHVMSSEIGRAGRPLQAVVQTAHPVTARPVSGVSVTARLVLDEDQSRVISSAGRTDARGLAVFRFRIPLDIGNLRSAGLTVAGRKGGLSAEVSHDVQLLRLASIAVSTDKPLYQPGQVLHMRALVRAWGDGPALPDVPVKVSIRDEQGDVVFEAPLATSRFGIVSTDWPMPEHTRLGGYVVVAEIDEEASGIQGIGGAGIKVSRYELPQFAVRAVPDRTYYLPGQKPKVEVRADYLFGKPVTRGTVRVALEARHEWDYKLQRYEIEERARQEGQLSTDGRYTAAFDLSEKEDFPSPDDDWPYRDIEGTAYVTDPTTGRTEEGRFTLRATAHAIHLYLIDRYGERCRGEDDRICRASFYVSASYADGTPASCEVGIARVSDDGEDDDESRLAEPLTKVRTNRFGLAKISDLTTDSAERDDAEDDETRLLLTARDADGRTGRQNARLSRWGSNRLMVDAGHAIHFPGHPIDVTIRSQSVRGAVLVDVFSGDEVLASRLVWLRGSSARIVFPYLPRFAGALAVTATAVAEADTWYSDGGSFGVVYPTGSGLRLDVWSDQAEYRPGEEARLRLTLKRGDGRPTPGVLGIVALDKALEERAASERGLQQPAGFLASFRSSDDSLAGISLADLLALDFRLPIPEGLDLVAEVALSRRWYGTRRSSTSDSFDRDSSKAFRALVEAQLRPMAEALRRRFDVEQEGPQELAAIHAALEDAAVGYASARDPWDHPYRITFGPRGRLTFVEFHSDGPDQMPQTTDDLLALSLAWTYFAPRGHLVERVAREHYEKTGAPIRDLDTLRADLAASGEDVAGWHDPWGQPFRFEFAVAGCFAVITSKSAGPDGVFATGGRSNDDVILSTVKTEYFSRERDELQKALDVLFEASGRFPQTTDDWAAVVALTNLEGLSDLWGHPLDVRFRSESEYADRVTIRAYADPEGPRRNRRDEVPVTRVVEVVSLWSAGPDGEVGGADDFELASFRRTVAERMSAVAELSRDAETILAPGTGAIVGRVTDAQGGVLPGASITVRNESTGQEWATSTTADGDYTLKGLAPGFYRVRAWMDGFKSALVTRVPVEAGQKTEVDVTLEVGQLTEAVTVSSRVQPLSTASAERSTTLEGGLPPGAQRPPIATPRVRRDFPETLYWQPALETDALGRAEVRVKLADTITTWKLAVVGSTIGGQAAIAERELLAFQPFFVENDPPPVLTLGDAIGLPAVVRNYTDGALRVGVEAQASDGLRIAGGARQDVRVPAGDAGQATFDLRAEQAAPNAKVVLTALSNKASDAVEKSVRVHPDGAETELADGLLLDRETVLELSVPDSAIAGSLTAELRVAPHLATLVLESVEAVMRRPYGCAEQTISSTYPSLLALRLLADSGSHQALAARARRYLQLGSQRLLGYQNPSGGFGYFHDNQADLALTAYAIRFLTDARGLLDIDEDVLDRARDFLLSRQEADGRWRARYWWETEENAQRSLSLTALIARALAVLPEPKSKAVLAGKEQPPVRGALDRAFTYLRERTDEGDDPYALASLALAAQHAGAAAEARRTLERLRGLARGEAGGLYWAHEANTPFFGWGRAGRIEITALAARALAASGETQDRSLVDKALLFLLHNRDRYGIWWSGQATVNVLDALITVIGALPKAGASDTVDVVVNGRNAATLTLPADANAMGPLTVDLTPHVAPGANRIELRRAHEGGKASAQAVARYYVPWPQAKTRTSDSLRLGVRFDRTEARRGESIGVHVEAERVGFAGYGMLLAEIGLPPGLDVDRESLDRAVASSDWGFCSYDIQPDRVVAYLWPRAGGMTFDFIVRPRLSMKAQSAPSMLYDYYNPEASVTLAPQTFLVRE